MEDKLFPRVLVTCVDCWRDDVGANTIPNWDPDKVAVVYTKSELPNLPYSAHYFQIAENDVVHASFHPGKKCGRAVEKEGSAEKKGLDYEHIVSSIKEEGKRYSFFRQHRLKLFYFARDLLWSFGSWKSKELDQFIEKFDPEVIFLLIYPYIYLNKIQSYIAKKAGVRGVAYIADDNFSFKPEWYNPLFWIQRFFLRKSIDEIMGFSNELLVILPSLIEEYKGIFDMPIHVLTKGIDTENLAFCPTEKKLPLKMIYTGNLFIGRDKTIIKVIEAIKKINQNETKVQLYIYSHIKLTKKLSRQLNVPGSSYFMGSVPISEVAQIQDGSDVVLFVEALDIFNRNRARLSFSTKLTDYFKSGKCIFAVGKRDIAPISYLEQNKCAVIAENDKEIYQNLKMLTENIDLLNNYGEKAFRVGKEKHSDGEMRNTFYHALSRASRKA